MICSKLIRVLKMVMCICIFTILTSEDPKMGKTLNKKKVGIMCKK